MPKTILLPLLANGEFHSGQDLANALGVSRTAVWKQLQKLEGLGLAIESVKGRGYRIPGGIELLCESQVRAGLNEQGSALLTELAVAEAVDSTNAEALRKIEQGAGAGVVCTAEQQTAGRGRRGRAWVSPYARNLYLSIVGEFTQGAAALEGLSLAAGVAVARALEKSGVPQVQLKWPNDILLGGAKLGGILLEMVGDAAGSCQVVVGVGVNVAMPAATAAPIEQDWTDVATISSAAGVAAPGRNALLAALLNELLPLVDNFEAGGFALWQEAWQKLDAHAGKPVVLTTGSEQLAGIARGVNERGALQLETTLGVQSVFGGEISLRVSE
ncbi:MAG: bifunctional biotin--[acetyl-CoA-carboxylase] ligase/biotin operon repressor BirA [Proteobacteria bacterium]|nr:bifunctional biotin--[acetyl-CoA-carboxylase] ligase/biotin operon repressor BirA [Pseudomonadota bacterium]